MARTEFTPLINKLNEAAELFANLFENLLQKAETEKAELKSLYARMKETSEDISMMADIGEEVGNIFIGVADTADHVSDTIKDTITGGESKVPDCPYEEFMCFCSECGSSIKVDETTYISSDDQWLCEKCHDTAIAEHKDGCECVYCRNEPCYDENCERAYTMPTEISSEN